MHKRYSILFLQKSHTTKILLIEHIELCFGFILVVSILVRMQGPIRPHMAIKPKIEVSAGGKAFTRLSLYYIVESYTVLA
jgi:hypothetical protein